MSTKTTTTAAQTQQTVKEQARTTIRKLAEQIARRQLSNEIDTNEIIKQALSADLSKDELYEDLRFGNWARSTIQTLVSRYNILKGTRVAERVINGTLDYISAYNQVKTPRYQPRISVIYRLANEVADEIRAQRTTLEEFNGIVNNILRQMEPR